MGLGKCGETSSSCQYNLKETICARFPSSVSLEYVILLQSVLKRKKISVLVEVIDPKAKVAFPRPGPAICTSITLS